MAVAATNDSPVKAMFRRDRLVAMEATAQQSWSSAHSFESDAGEASENKDKYFVVFPFPYSNGSLHLGHAFSLSKAEFTAGYQRMKGKHVLFPFGFHCTGMPIAASVLKLQREIKQYGLPPVFSKDSLDSPHQWTILAEMGVPHSEIHEFCDPLKWLQYFPPLAMKHLKRFGLKADFRRSFITTEVNPFFDKFIQWQFNTLKERNKIAFGNRLSIFSPADDQACADHDRATGEGVTPQEYTAIKMRVVKPYPECLQPFEDSIIYFLAATLRPETMYGQTNCWILPTGSYKVLKAKEENNLFVMSERAALNMAYQNLLVNFGEVDVVATVSGTLLLGCALSAPKSVFEIIYTLPLLTIKMNKGTGVVTSVPSDSPDDFIAFQELRNSKSMRTKYALTDDMVLPYEPVPIIHIDGLGDLAAQHVVQQMNIKSQHDRKKLDNAKEQVYNAGFYKGIMMVGNCIGMSVQDAKLQVRQELIDAGECFIYSEPEKSVISRSGNECVAALTDQWYLRYGEEQWQSMVMEHVQQRLETFSSATKKCFIDTVNWLREWGCSRSFGLGTKLPWDPQFVIESLSDSTIYMAYYCIAHILQDGSLDGSIPASPQIDANDLTDDVLNYIFQKAPFPSSTNIDATILAKMKNEFEYWYPVDLRVSGKDLIRNHLTMAIYNHAAIWPSDPSKWPQAYFTNGYALLNGQKMSKSTGNFITIDGACEIYGSDAVRLALADAGDGLEDANVALTTTADKAILRLTKELDFFLLILDEIKKSDDSKDLRSGNSDFLLLDRIFANEINIAISKSDTSFSNMMFRDAVKYGMFELSNARDRYRACCHSTGMHSDLILRYIKIWILLISPICPHFAEHSWSLIGESGLVVDQRWPSADIIDSNLTIMSSFLDQVHHLVCVKYNLCLKPKKDKKKKSVNLKTLPTSVVFSVARNYPEWHTSTIAIISALFETDPASITDKAVVMKALKSSDTLQPFLKAASALAFNLVHEIGVQGVAAFDISLPFDEAVFIRQNVTILMRDLPFTDYSIEVIDSAIGFLPGKPSVRFVTD